MFYSHDILTSREHGVATVWVVATLGSRSTLKRVGRRDILQVDIAGACRAISTPVAPMALRLQSSLLYGVTRVFSEQCSYVLGDVQATTNNVRQILRTTFAPQLEMEATKLGRQNNLLLTDDPAFDPSQFVPDFGLDDLNHGLHNHENSVQNISSPHSLFSQGSIPALIIPSSAASMGGVFGSFSNSDPAISRLGQYLGGIRGPLSEMIMRTDDELLPEADFSVNADGFLIEADIAPPSLREAPTTHSEQEQVAAHAVASDGITSIMQQQGHDVQKDTFRMEHYAALPVPAQNDANRKSHMLSSSVHDDSYQSSEFAMVHMSRKSHRNKPLRLDRGALELHNSDIAAWSMNYLANMREAANLRRKSRVRSSGKKNAIFWTWKSGIGGVGLTASLRTFKGRQDPLYMFHGEKLFNMLRGPPSLGNRKRPSLDSADDLERHVRRRTGSLETARAIYLSDSSMNELSFRGEEYDIEQGRNAPTPLQGGQDYDTSSSMPWNIGSGQGSRNVGSVTNLYKANTRSSTTPMPLGRRSHHQRQQQGLTRASASPMLGHDDPAELSFGNDDGYQTVPAGLADSSEEDEIARIDRGALTDAETIGESQYVHQVLEIESGNFHGFVKQAIAAHVEATGLDEQSIKFGVLLPPSSTTHVVAAQALLHSLNLAAKGILHLRQSTHFGDIWLTP